MLSPTNVDSVFQFVLLRPPTKVEDSISLANDSDFQDGIRTALTLGSKEAARKAADEFRHGDRFTADLDGLAYGDQYRELNERLGALDQPDVDDIVEDLYGMGLRALADDGRFQFDRETALDSLVASKYGSDQSFSTDDLELAVRMIELITRRVNGEDVEVSALPMVFDPTAAVPDDDDDDQDDLPGIIPGDEPALGLHDRYRGAIAELQAAERAGSLTFTGADQLEIRQPPSPGLLSFFRRSGATIEVVGEVAELRLQPTAVDGLSAETRGVLEELNIDAASMPVAAAANQIHHALVSYQPQPEEPDPQSMVFSQMMMMAPPDGGWGLVEQGKQGAPVAAPTNPIKPAGIGDLLVVRQQINRYEGGEVAHIENILKGEHKNRTHRRLDRQEDTLTVETESTTTNEQETATTERFELQREVASTIEADASTKLGATVSGSYGPTVEFSVSAELESSFSSSKSTQTATSYAKDVTERSVQKLVERVREEQVRKIIREVEETNEHGVNNVDGDGHIAGVYQWVDKVYQAQIYNYGTRLMFDIMVPDPAAFTRYALASAAGSPDMPLPPIPFTLKPNQINEGNYPIYVARYQATGVSAPPPPYIQVSAGFDERTETDTPQYSKTGSLQIPPGYAATSAKTPHSVAFREDRSDLVNLRVFLGGKRFEGFSTSLPSLEGTIPVGVHAIYATSFAVTFQVNCQRTPQKLADWQLETWEAINAAFQDRVREYEAQLAAARAEALGIEISGRNPGENRRIERTELKKSAIEMLTEQRFDHFGAVDQRMGLLPEIDFDEARAEGAFVKFFEHAFEWEHLTYLFYPYFWGEKSHWIERFLTDDTDPQFAEFLRAGSARVMLPVRLGFDIAVLHYLETGQIWNGLDEPPGVNDPLFVSLAQEIRERTGDFDGETPVGESWEIRIPTSLVRLRSDDQLPAWIQQEDGSWVPSPETQDGGDADADVDADSDDNNA